MNSSILALSKTCGTRKALLIRLGLLLASGCVLAVLIVRGVTTGTPQEQAELLWALEDTRNALQANPGCPPDQVEEKLAGAFFLLHPDIALRELRRDPAYAEEEQKAISEFMNPNLVLAERMKDPEFRRNQEEARRTIGGSAETP